MKGWNTKAITTGYSSLDENLTKHHYLACHYGQRTSQSPLDEEQQLFNEYQERERIRFPGKEALECLPIQCEVAVGNPTFSSL